MTWYNIFGGKLLGYTWREGNMKKKNNMEITLISGEKVDVTIVHKNSPRKKAYLSENDIEMDKRASAAVTTAIDKAKICGKPIARYNPETRQVYMEYADGSVEYVK